VPPRPPRIAGCSPSITARADDRHHDPNPKHYAISVEADVMIVMAALAAAPAIVIGTSRGGLIATTLAATKPELLAGVVLNDIGPVVETEGVMRIKGYVGQLSQPASYQQGAEMLRRISGNQFPKLGAAEWLAAAKLGCAWREGGRLVSTYDPALARTLEGVSAEKPFPTMWPKFDAMAPLPLMVVHGANSDILGTATVAAMRARRPDMELLGVCDQDHAPLLAEPGTIGPIAAFAGRCDALRAVTAVIMPRRKDAFLLEEQYCALFCCSFQRRNSRNRPVRIR
jgi:pimeloyl-ACP methyl ester carboxylesterase